MDFSIIIINYNTKDFLRNCLESIFQNKFDLNFEVIVVDNDSTDNSRKFLSRFKVQGSEFKVVFNNENIGFAAACNQGAKIAQAKILFFLNPDILIKENIFPKVIKVFEKNPKVGIVAPGLILPDGLPQPWTYGREQGLWQLIKNKFHQNSVQSPNYPSTPALPAGRQSPTWVSGAALFIRSDVFKRIGGFDENFFMYFEDRDLCRKVKNIGYKIVLLLDMEIIHFGGRSLFANKVRKKLYYRSQNYYWRKHYGFLKSLLARLIRWPYKFYILNIKK